MSIRVTIADGIAPVMLNRADKLNAVSAEMYHALHRTVNGPMTYGMQQRG
jgi:enoyl-CoA hydratase/carnithine racemase